MGSFSLFSILEAGLKYKYYQVWDLVLELLQAFYSIANSHCSKFLKKVFNMLKIIILKILKEGIYYL